MKFGIIAEGRGDCAVLQNILIGLGLIDSLRDIRYFRPEFSADNTDLSTQSASSFSSWTLVKRDCIERHNFRNFFERDNDGHKRIMIVHIDTAECYLPEIGVEKPDRKEDGYCEILRERVVHKITEWLENQYLEDTRFAIAIEETEAWLLALCHQGKKVDTSSEENPKKAFEKYLRERQKRDKPFDKEIQRLKSKGAFAQFDFHSADFQKLGKQKVRTCLDNNPSLKRFIESLPEPATQVS